MAKAIVPMRQWSRREHVTRKLELERRLRELFIRGIVGEAETANGRMHSGGSRNGA